MVFYGHTPDDGDAFSTKRLVYSQHRLNGERKGSNSQLLVYIYVSAGTYPWDHALIYELGLCNFEFQFQAG